MRRVGTSLVVGLLAVLGMNANLARSNQGAPHTSATEHVYVPKFAFGSLPYVTKPRKLGIGAKGLVERLRWYSWDRSVAKGRGYYSIAGSQGIPPTKGVAGPVRMRFFSRRTCSDGTRIYVRFKTVPIRKRDRGLRQRGRWTSCERLEDQQ